MKRDPNHLGAIHYYIHAVEASSSPERALAGANRLAAMAPAAGHIVHIRRTSTFAPATTRRRSKRTRTRRCGSRYIKSSEAQGIYR